MLTMSDFHGQFPAKENRFKVCNKDTETMSKAKFIRCTKRRHFF